MTRFAAKIFVVLTLGVVLFQLALTLGAPWGEFTQGGAHPGQLPARMRVVSAVSAVVLLAFAAVVAARAGLAFPRLQRASMKLIWLVLAYSVVGLILNAITPSARERLLWLPVAAIMAACVLVVARAR